MGGVMEEEKVVWKEKSLRVKKTPNNKTIKKPPEFLLRVPSQEF